MMASGQRTIRRTIRLSAELKESLKADALSLRVARRESHASPWPFRDHRRSAAMRLPRRLFPHRVRAARSRLDATRRSRRVANTAAWQTPPGSLF